MTLGYVLKKFVGSTYHQLVFLIRLRPVLDIGIPVTPLLLEAKTEVVSCKFGSIIEITIT